MRKKPYPREFRAKIVELARAGRTVKELAVEFGPHVTTIQSWVNQDERDNGKRTDGLTTDEREELRKLRREIRQLRVEREILAKATAWFARETESSPSRRSS